MAPQQMTPPAPPWKYDDLEAVRLECIAFAKEKHDTQNKANAELKATVEWLRNNYVSSREFDDYKELVQSRYDRVVKNVDGIMWAIILGIISAVVAWKFPGVH